MFHSTSSKRLWNLKLYDNLIERIQVLNIPQIFFAVSFVYSCPLPTHSSILSWQFRYSSPILGLSFILSCFVTFVCSFTSSSQSLWFRVWTTQRFHALRQRITHPAFQGETGSAADSDVVALQPVPGSARVSVVEPKVAEAQPLISAYFPFSSCSPCPYFIIAVELV